MGIACVAAALSVAVFGAVLAVLAALLLPAGIVVLTIAWGRTADSESGAHPVG